MKTKISLITLFASCLFFSACVSKEAPSEVGELMTEEQITNLPKDDAYNKRLVAVDGYWNFASHLIKSGTKNNIVISSEPNGRGTSLIRASVGVNSSENEGITLAGAASRNIIKVAKPVDIKTCVVITDDYNEVGYQKMRFSGTLVYENGEYKLENITLHSL